jgi:hypothetical protein
VGGIRHTLKEGIVYDAKKLLADVGAMVEGQKDLDRTGRPESRILHR